MSSRTGGVLGAVGVAVASTFVVTVLFRLLPAWVPTFAPPLLLVIAAAAVWSWGRFPAFVPVGIAGGAAIYTAILYWLLTAFD